MFVSCNWEKLVKMVLICYGNMGKLKNVSFLKNFDKLLVKFFVQFLFFFWLSFIEVDVEVIKNIMEVNLFIKKFNFFVESYKLEFFNSLGLCYKDEVVGWMFIYCIVFDIICYIQMFVDLVFQFFS